MEQGDMTVTVLGSAGSFPQPGNPSSGYLVRTPGSTIWIDCGAGTFGALQGLVALEDLDAIIVSHEHADHSLELVHVHTAARFVLGLVAIPVYATASTRELIEPLVHAELEPTFSWTTIDATSTLSLGDATVTFARTDHPVETLAVRVETGGRVFGYSADTGPGWSFAELDPTGAGFDVAICEATLNPEHAGLAQHLTATEAATMAAASGVDRLVLTHMYHWTVEDRLAEAVAAFPRTVLSASPGDTFIV